VSQSLSVQRVDRVDVITIDDGKANALSPELISRIGAAIAAAEADDGVGAVVLSGRDGRFSAGFDLSVIQGGDAGAIVGLVSDGGALVRQLYGCGVPVVAACSGHALAAGALLLLGCDVRIGADGPFKLGLNEVAIGLTLPDWALTIAADRLSKRHGQRSIVNARITDPRTAVDVGFLDQVVAPQELIATAMTEATALASLDPRAYRATVRQLRGPTLDRMDLQIAADRANVD